MLLDKSELLLLWSIVFDQLADGAQPEGVVRP